MIERKIISKIQEILDFYPVVSINGPRQSGKSTLLINKFPEYRYINLEDINYRRMAIDDPKGFIMANRQKTIIDEAQYAPDLFSFIQLETDSKNNVGQYILSGSQNFLLMKSISQSLAGRVGIAELLPLSYQELKEDQETDIYDFIFQGAYPRLYNAKKSITVSYFYSDYIKTYINKDINELLNVKNLVSFNKFLTLCALRVGQVLNIAALAKDCEIKFDTAKSWLSVLESSYIIKLVPPYFKNLNKRLVKSPKLYFLDTGLLNHLLSIKSVDRMLNHKYYGQVYENYVFIEIYKNYLNAKMDPKLYFFRDSNGNEIDIIDETDVLNPIAIEIKSGMMSKPEFAKKLNQNADLLEIPKNNRFIIYNGDPNFEHFGVKFATTTGFYGILNK